MARRSRRRSRSSLPRLFARRGGVSASDRVGTLTEAEAFQEGNRQQSHAAVRAARPMRVAFVVCPPFHGATLLALLLNNHSQISALGDMLPLRDRNQLCACGQPSRKCDFWSTVFT